MAPRVSVVVAVYNPGPYLEPLIDSLARQSMPAGEWEGIFVDDGSTDGSGARLDRLAEAERHIRVIHIPNSGWPGRPRNVGLDAATGAYVCIVDHDDWLGAEALERLVDRAERNEADVVMGKEVGHGFGVPLVAFRRNVDDARLGVDPLQTLLTPHKLFRRSMLDEHGIRFPEGKRRLEDHLFVMHAYFHARRISIMADYPWYHWTLRGDRSNATHRRVSWTSYFENVGEILDLVDAHTEPGPLRDRLKLHWYHSKTLHKLRGRRWYESEPGAAALSQFDAVRSFVLRRFPVAFDPGLSVRYRVVARAVRAGSVPLLSAQARLIDGVAATVTVERAEPRDTTLALALVCTLRTPDGEPMAFVRRDGRLRWAPPEPLASDPALLPEDLDVTDSIGESNAVVILRHRASRTQYTQWFRLPLEERDGTVLASATVEAVIDPATAAAGLPLSDGIWDVLVQLQCCGWEATQHLSDLELGAVGTGWMATPYVNAAGRLSFKVVGSPGPVLETPPEVVLPPSPPSPAKPASTSLRRVLRRTVPTPVRRAALRIVERFAH